MFRYAFVALLFSMNFATAEEPKIPYRLLPPEKLETLKKNKFVIADEEYKQVFTPYLGSDLPYFITSDSLLNAYHVLFEESVRQLEQHHAEQLPIVLLQLLERLPEEAKQFDLKAETIAAAKLRAERILGVALRLSGKTAGKFDKESEALITEEVQFAQEAKGSRKPAWLGEPDAGFLGWDYSRFIPRGFYTNSELLKRHFRAVSWLQAVPFRANREEEFLSAMLLARAIRNTNNAEVILNPFAKFLGEVDDMPVSALIPLLRSEQKVTQRGFNAARANAVEESKKRPLLASDLLARKPEASFRIMPAYQLTDAMLMQRTATRNRKPSGLDVAAMLGSPVAKDYLKKNAPKEVLAAIEEQLAQKDGPWSDSRLEKSLHGQYLKCLRVLVSEKEPNWPKFMNSPEWQWKQCQAALSGWAQERHTWVLQTKRNLYFSIIVRPPPGFVEPVPRFCETFAMLCDVAQARFQPLEQKSEETLIRSEPLTSENKSELLFQLEFLLAEIDEYGLKINGSKLLLETLDEAARHHFFRKVRDLTNEEHPGALTAKRWKELDKTIIAKRDSLQAEINQYRPNVCAHWKMLKDLTQALATISKKQLQQKQLDKDDIRTCKGYGKKLAEIMFHVQTAAHFPRDDAPRVADVHFNSQAKAHLHVGIGRPRAIYVLYPWDGNEVLCRGAVLPYYEFDHAEPLTDTKWREMLSDRNGRAPKQPEWLTNPK